MIVENAQVQNQINWLGNLSAVANVALLILTFVSVKYAYQAYKHQKDRAKKDAACSLAKCFADYIIEQTGFIGTCMRVSKCTDIIENIFPIDSLVLFDKSELEELIKNNAEDFEELRGKLDSMDPISIAKAELMRAKTFQEARIIRDHIRMMMLNDTNVIGEESHESKVKKMQLQQECKLIESFYVAKYYTVLTELQNKLEWFSMTCRYGLADEEMIYQSLHTVFLHTVWTISYYISIKNISADDKLFTNVIWLFNHWRNRSIEIKENIKTNEYEASEKLKKVKRGSSWGYAGKTLN